MDRRMIELIDFTKAKFGLNNYYLQRHSFYRSVNIFNKTVYTLCMEWFPNHVTEQEDDDLNPEGTAVIDMNVHSRKLESVIFVGGKSYANGTNFCNYDTKDIIEWVEKESGLTYGQRFQLHKEEEGEFHFKACINGVTVFPPGSIEIKFNQEGALTLFAVHGQFPSKEMIKEETYTLSLEKVEHIADKQLKLIEFPLSEQERLLPVYAMEEIYVPNDKMSIIPVEFIVDVRSSLEINESIYWDTPINKPFERKEVQMIEDVSIEQVLSCEPSPDSFPISKVEQKKCIVSVKDFLRQEYPNDTGKWVIKTLQRDKGYIHATLRANEHDSRLFQRKLTIIMDAKSLQVLNYVDNKQMLEIFDQFQAPGEITVNKEEAFEKIKGFFELTHHYVYDFEQHQYILCGKLDCPYGMNAESGEVIALDNL